MSIKPTNTKIMRRYFTRGLSRALVQLMMMCGMLICLNDVLAQGVAINENGSVPDNSAILDVSSTRKGVLFPRMTASERNLINTPAEGLIIYNTDDDCLQMYISNQWQNVYCDLGCSVPPTAPGSITGSTVITANQTGVTYSISSVTDAISYSWTVPTGATIVSGQGTTSITVDFGASSGDVCVSAANNCGSSAQTCMAVTVGAFKSGDFEASSNQYLSIEDGVQSGLDLSGDLTIECWVKFESLSGNIAFLSKWVSSGNNLSYGFRYLSGTQELSFHNSSNGSTASWGTDVSYTFSTNTWYHVATVYDASAGSAEMFVNGLSVGTSTGLANSIYNGTGSVKIGATQGGSDENFDGLIDDMRVWNVKRTQNELCSNIAVGSITGNESNLAAYWTLDGILADGTSNGNDLVNNNSTPFSTDEGTGSCTLPDYKSIDVERDNSQYLSISDGNQTGLDLNSDFTLEAWIKLESDVPNNSTFFIMGKDGSGASNRGYYLSYNNNGGTRFLQSYFGNGSGGHTFDETNYTLPVGTWLHIAVTVDISAQTFTYYIDGSPISVGTYIQQGATTINNTNNAFSIGTITDGTDRYFDGLIDEVRVWSDIRTTQEICSNMAVASINGSEANLVGYWTLDGVLSDATSNGNDLANNNNAAFSTDESSGSCTPTKSIDIEGDSNQTLSIADGSQTGLDLSADFTVEAWAKFESLPSGARYNVVGKSNPSGNQRGYGAGVYESGGNYYMSIYIYDDGNTPATSAVSDAISITADTWYHLAFVKDGTTGVFYLNGQPQGSTGTLDASIYNNSSPFVIGAERADGTDGFDGLLDDVRVWNTVRNEVDICNNINPGNITGSESGLVGYWTLDGTLADGTSNSNNLTNNNGAVFDTDEGTGTCTPPVYKSVDLEADNSQYLSIADGSQSGLDITADITIEAWVKIESFPENMSIVCKGDGYDDQGYNLMVASDGSVWAQHSDATGGGTSMNSRSQAGDITAGTWYHIAMTWVAGSGNPIRLFINGAEVSYSNQQTGHTFIRNSSDPLWIGKREYNGSAQGFVDGLIDDVRIWSSARSDLDICNNISPGSITGSESNLEGYWTMDGVLTDGTSNGNDLINNNSAVFSTDEGSGTCTPPDYKSSDFEVNSTQYLSISDGSQTGLGITGDLTIEFWAKWESIQAVVGLVSKWDEFGTNNRSYQLRYKSDGGGDRFVFAVSQNGSNATEKEWSFLPTVDTWYHIAMVYDASAGSSELFINGASQGAQSGNYTSIYNGNSSVWVGSTKGGSGQYGYFDGLMDDIRIWNVAKSSTDICSDMAIGNVAGSESGLQAYWTLDGVLTDATSNGNTLSNTNGVAYSPDESTGSCSPPPVFESISSVSVTGGHPLNIPKPSGLQVGDLMVAIIGAPNDFSTSSSDGFTELYDFYANEGNMCHMGVYWKIATASDVAATDFSFTTNTSQSINGCILRISGANQTNPINASSNNINTANTSNPSFSGITPSIGNCLMLVAVNHADNQRSVSGYTIPNDNPSWTERYDAQGVTGDTGRGFGMAVATAPRPQTTATGNWSCTYSGGELRQVGVIIAIAPQ